MGELGIGTDLDCRPAVNVIQKLIFVKPSLQVTFGVYDIFEPTPDGKAKKSDKSLTTPTVKHGTGVRHHFSVRRSVEFQTLEQAHLALATRRGFFKSDRRRSDGGHLP